MSKKTKTVFVCNNCGEDYAKWQGHCSNCNSWNTIAEFKQARIKGKRASSSDISQAEIISISDVPSQASERIDCAGFPEVNKVLGGGLVPGALILLGGDPGIGKSTLLLQLMAGWTNQESSKTLYVSGEESLEQISLRAQRLNVSAPSLNLLTETTIEVIIAKLEEVKPDVVVIDSIQTMYSEQLESAPGSVSQVRECGAMLLRFAKDNGTSIFLIGHVTKDGAIAGPRLLEHMVDTVLYFEGDNQYQYRIVRAVKNRFGPSGEIAILSMSDSGLHEVANPSEFFLLNHTAPQPGTSTVPIIEGSRVLVVELQALVNRSHFGIPQRVASGINPKKLSLLLAVLERFGGIVLGDHDVFFNIAGGLNVTEPATDLGIAAAILSSFSNKPIRKGVAFIGEIGLGGEIRPVSRMNLRLKELSRLGFGECLVANPTKKVDWESQSAGLKLLKCSKAGEIGDLIF